MDSGHPFQLELVPDRGHWACSIGGSDLGNAFLIAINEIIRFGS